jgi:hypothetical protein
LVYLVAKLLGPLLEDEESDKLAVLEKVVEILVVSADQSVVRKSRR